MAGIQDGAQNRAGLTEVEQLFLEDVEIAVEALEGIYAKPDEIGDEELDLYEITVHGMKSALLNVGNTELSATAKKLEQASKDKDLTLMAAETPAFIDELKALYEKLAGVAL